MKYTLAYIDEEETSLSNFYSFFKNDYELILIKADENSTIDSIVKECFENQVDAIVTDYKLEDGNVDFNGDQLFRFVKLKHPHFPFVMLTSFEPEAIDHMEDVHLIYNKEILNGKNEMQFGVLSSKIKSNIDNYYKKVVNTDKKIDELNQITELSIEQEEELTKLYILYDELHPDGKEIPTNLIKKESMTQLSEFVIEAKGILEELRRLNKNEF